MQAIEFTLILDEMFGCRLSSGTLFQHPNIRELTSHLLHALFSEDQVPVSESDSIKVTSTVPFAPSKSRRLMAIVAMACRFPGGANVEELWQNVKSNHFLDVKSLEGSLGYGRVNREEIIDDQESLVFKTLTELLDQRNDYRRHLTSRSTGVFSVQRTPALSTKRMHRPPIASPSATVSPSNWISAGRAKRSTHFVPVRSRHCIEPFKRFMPTNADKLLSAA